MSDGNSTYNQLAAVFNGANHGDTEFTLDDLDKEEPIIHIARLQTNNLQTRTSFFRKLKSQIETLSRYPDAHKSLKGLAEKLDNLNLSNVDETPDLEFDIMKLLGKLLVADDFNYIKMCLCNISQKIVIEISPNFKQNNTINALEQSNSEPTSELNSSDPQINSDEIEQSNYRFKMPCILL